MPQGPTVTVRKNHRKYVIVADYAADNTLDTTEALQCFTSASNIVTAAVDPLDNRKVWITGAGVSTGGQTITVAAPGVPTASVLVYPVVVEAAPDLSRVEHVSMGAEDEPL